MYVPVNGFLITLRRLREVPSAKKGEGIEGKLRLIRQAQYFKLRLANLTNIITRCKISKFSQDIKVIITLALTLK